MKSLVISLGGTKAARIADILAYYSKKLDARIYVEVFDPRGHPITDAKVKVSRLESTTENPGLALTKTPGLIPYRIDVTRDGYQPVSEIAEIKPEQVSIARVILAKEPVFPLLTTVFLTLLAPFIWALLRYMGLLFGYPPADFMSLATLLFFALLAGAFVGIRTIGRTLFTLTKNRYFSALIGIIVGEVVALVTCNGILGFLVGFINLLGDLFGGYVLQGADIAIIAVFIFILAGLGGVLDDILLPVLNRNWVRSSIFVALGAMYGGLLNYLYSGRIVSALLSGAGTTDISAFFPFIVLVFTLIWCYAVLHFLKEKNLLIREKQHFTEGAFSLIGAGIISFMLPVLFGKTGLLLSFPTASLSGALAGIILYFLLFGGLSVQPGLESLTDGECLRKRYRLQTTPFVVDTVRSRLECLKCVPPECFLYIDESDRDPSDFLKSDLKDQIRRQINAIYRMNLEDCARLFSSFTIVIDLRNNNLCAIYPQVIEYLRAEYSVPIYAVVISTDKKMNRNWMRIVAEKADAVFPVDHTLFDGSTYLDRFRYQNGGEILEEEVYEEGCVVELISRLAPLLEIGERQSPAGLDVSHITRMLSRDRMPASPCNEIPDVISPSKQNVSTFGYFRLHAKKCRNLNLELGMGEYLEFALKHTLWRMERSTKFTRAIVIVRARGGLAKIGLVREWMNTLYDGLVLITGDLLTESDDTLEIIILVSYILEDIEEDPDAGNDCQENLPDNLTRIKNEP